MNDKFILFICSDIQLISLIGSTISQEKWTYLFTSDYNSAVELVQSHNPELVLLDTSLSDLNSFEFCNNFRSFSSLPLIVLSKHFSMDDKLECLNSGADEYLVVDDDPRELIAQINTLLKNRNVLSTISNANDYIFVYGELTINFRERKVSIANKEILLTPTEFSILHILVKNTTKVCPYSLILETIWGKEYSEEKTYIHTYIKRLRTKLKNNQNHSQYIITVPSIGYRFVNPE
jgi:two-component system, OmpR family, KDP operon response regulator KdpE